MTGVAVITESCLDSNERACVDVCPVQCIYAFDAIENVLSAQVAVGDSPTGSRRAANADMIAVFGDSILYVNPDECTACGACCQPGVCPSGAIYFEDRLPDGSPGARYNERDRYRGHDHTFFAHLSRSVFADTLG